ncbi:ankyrin repeat-containing domain protein [Aspergillus karnatakaensis]|uniref:ankyrin repeat protein n=1 Tax=Aspergillus karnatakaensis TaxID=1810916 RepID=UPI003CCDEF67
MARLIRLPAELILHIAQYLSSQRDINSLLRSHRVLYHLLHPYLCRFNARRRDGSAFVFAARNGDISLIHKLLNAGSSIGSVEARDPEDCAMEEWGTIINPLVIAAQNSHLAALNVLLNESRANEIIEHLLLQGAEVNVKENPHPWYEAAVQRGGEMLQLLFKYGRRPKSDRALSEVAFRSNDPSLLEPFTQAAKGDPMIDIRVYGHTALFTAVDRGHFEVVKYLIQRGANPNLTAQYKFWRGDFSITWMAVQALARQVETLEYLVKQHGVRPDQDALDKARELRLEDAISLLEEFSYENIPGKMDISSYVAMMELKSKKPSPESYAMDWLPCLVSASEPQELPLIEMYSDYSLPWEL